MKELLLEHWRDVFGRYIVRDEASMLAFEIPGFPEALMSMKFFLGGSPLSLPESFISFEDKLPNCEVRQVFRLCSLSGNEPRDPLVEQLSLDGVLAEEDYWASQEAHDPKTRSFMHRFLPWLVEQKGQCSLFFLREGGHIVASTVAVESSAGVLLLNGLVAEKERGKGKMQRISSSIVSAFPDKKVFFWTVHPWLFSRRSESSFFYLLIRRS